MSDPWGIGSWEDGAWEDGAWGLPLSDATVEVAAAISMTMSVNAVAASHATRPAVPLLWLYSAINSATLTIESNVGIASVISLAIAAKEPPHIGVVEMVFADAAIELATDLKEAVPVLPLAEIPASSIALALALKAATTNHSSAAAAGSPLTISTLAKEAIPRIDAACLPETITLSLAVPAHEARGSVNVVIAIGGVITASLVLKPPTIRCLSVVSVSQAATITTALKPPSYAYDYLKSIDDPPGVALTLKDNRATCGWLHPVDGALRIEQLLLEPAGVAASSNIRPAAMVIRLVGNSNRAVLSSNVSAPDAPGMSCACKEPAYSGPDTREFVMLSSRIVRTLNVTSELTIRMAAYG